MILAQSQKENLANWKIELADQRMDAHLQKLASQMEAQLIKDHRASQEAANDSVWNLG